MTKIGWSALTGVGVVCRELPDILQSSSPVPGSYPNMVPAPFVTNSTRSLPTWIVGVENEIDPRYRVAVQLNTLIAEGIATSIVSSENRMPA